MPVRQVELPSTQAHLIRSRHVDQEFEIRVGLPQQSWGPPLPAAFPVLYVLDGDLFFGTAMEMTRLMNQLFQELPPILVVGVGYGTDDPRVQAELRNRDFTPTRIDPPNVPAATDWEPALPEEQRLGHAEKFLRFLVEELKPFVSNRFPVTETTTLFGSSLGGLFGLYAMLEKPEAFSNYVIASPSIWWDEEWLLGFETRIADARDDLPVKLFMGVGSLEEPKEIPWLAAMKTVTNVGVMRERLASRGYASLDVSTHVFENETHTSVVPAVLTRGLRTLHPRSVPS